MDLPREEAPAGRTLAILRWSQHGSDTRWALRGGGGRQGVVLDSFSLHALHILSFPPANVSCLAWDRITRTLLVSALVGLCHPRGFLTVSQGWEFQPIPASLRTWRPRRGKGCDSGSESNWVNLNPDLWRPVLPLLPSRSLWTPALQAV